jgi:hypothetical protein
MKAGEALVGSKDKIWKEIIKIKMTCSWGDEKRKLLKIEQ